MAGRRSRKRESRGGARNGKSVRFKGSVAVDFEGECGKRGASGRGDGVENFGLDDGLIESAVEVSGNVVSVSSKERGDFGVTSDFNSGSDVGVKQSGDLVDQKAEENGGVELGGKKGDLISEDGMVGGESCSPGKVGQSPNKCKGKVRRGKLGPDVSLRRSARRAAMVTTLEKAATLATPEQPILVTPEKANASPVKGVETDSVVKHLAEDCENVVPELPPSSRCLNLDGLHVLDVFSIYSCLRSFSISLFLSPFSLEAFVEALHCRFANSLIDSIHLSLLVALKKHLENLSEEKNVLASDCIRAFNWELLDFATWPLYLIGYILFFHVSALEACFKLSSLKLLGGEYYKQPGKVKLQILRFLCDDLLEGDFIRSALRVQIVTSEPNVDFDQNVPPQTQNENFVGDYLPSAQQSTVMGKGYIDGNVDDCCLCKMDGVLICCDGCPAAFHSRCVGIARDTLPEGEWYCPECLVGKANSTELLKSFHGAELLGIDTHGRIYFGSCGYLLVSDFHDANACRYYNKCDIGSVIEILSKSSNSLYTDITSALSSYCGEKEKIQCGISLFSSPMKNSCEMTSKKLADCSVFISDSDKISSATANVLPLKDNSTTCLRKSIGNHFSHIRVAHASICSLKHDGLSLDTAGASTKQAYSTNHDHVGSVLAEGKSWTIKMQSTSAIYVNHYGFGRVASSIAEKIVAKSLEAKRTKNQLTTEYLVTDQLDAISSAISKFEWPVVQRLSWNTLKESCGWCLSCRSVDDQECLFKVTEKKLAQESKKASLGFRSIKNRKSHFPYAVHRLLFIEDNLHGLLSGPWQNPAYRKLWRKNVLKATDVKALKQLLLELEANLRRVVLSADWVKSLSIDTDLTFGLASHSMTVPVPDHSKNLGVRKRGRRSKIEINKHNLDAWLSGTYWWRGARLSRRVFHWKMLPRSLALKGARQGCQKIPELKYPEGSLFVLRSKVVAWRAAVEMSKTIAELIYYLKDLDSNIRWNALKNTSVFRTLAKDPMKRRKSLKNVLIRRKCLDGDRVNYIIDFGRRKVVPDAISKYAIKYQETSSGRKKYWLNEYDIPLGLLKAFEVKKLEQAAKSNKPVMKIPSDEILTTLNRPKGFSYLFSKLEESECRKCAHCGDDVLVRQAVSCQGCEGIFHRKHFRLPKSVTDAVYTCSACKKREATKLKSIKEKDKVRISKVYTAKLKYPSKKRKNTVILGSRKMIRFAEEGKNGAEYLFNSCKRKRTAMQHCYWSNGLRWSVKQEDDGSTSFRSTNILMPAMDGRYPSMNPICFLCHEEYNPSTIYLCCEKCGDWLHGDAVSVNMENVRSLIGFRCHKCCQTNIPICPYRRSESTPEVHPPLVNGGFQDNGADVQNDEVRCRSEHNSQQVELVGSSLDSDVYKRLTGEFTFDTSQCPSPDGNLCLSDITQTGNTLQPDLRTDDNEVKDTEDSTSGKQNDVSFLDLSCDLEPGNCEGKLTKLSTEQKQMSFGKAQKCDTESKIRIDAPLGEEDKSLDSEVLQVGLLNHLSIVHSNSYTECCNKISDGHDGTANIMQHGGCPDP